MDARFCNFCVCALGPRARVVVHVQLVDLGVNLVKLENLVLFLARVPLDEC